MHGYGWPLGIPTQKTEEEFVIIKMTSIQITGMSTWAKVLGAGVHTFCHTPLAWPQPNPIQNCLQYLSLIRLKGVLGDPGLWGQYFEGVWRGEVLASPIRLSHQHHVGGQVQESHPHGAWDSGVDRVARLKPKTRAESQVCKANPRNIERL